jgi:hypothetical protein
MERSEAALHGLSPVGCRYHHRNRMHHLILGCEALHPLAPGIQCLAAITPPGVAGHA